MESEKAKKIAEFIQDECMTAARQGFKDAQMQGLCSEGAQEAAISAIQMLDVETLLQEMESADNED